MKKEKEKEKKQERKKERKKEKKGHRIRIKISDKRGWNPGKPKKNNKWNGKKRDRFIGGSFCIVKCIGGGKWEMAIKSGENLE